MEGTGGMHAVNLPFPPIDIMADDCNVGAAALPSIEGWEPRVYFENFRGREGCLKGGKAPTINVKFLSTTFRGKTRLPG